MISQGLKLLALALAAICACGVAPARAQLPLMACSGLAASKDRIAAIYGPRQAPFAAQELAEDVVPAGPVQRLDQGLFDTALASYDYHFCRRTGGRGYGPAQIVIIDFAKPSAMPRLYVVDLLSGYGLDTPIRVAHGIGSDPNDDGIADRFGNAQYSLMSSLGAARGAELYRGINGLSLRLDGLEPSNNAMRLRDIVAHSYPPEHYRYFNPGVLNQRRGNPGTSEGCIVVEPHLRDWLFGILADGGFLFAGLGGERSKEMYAVPPPMQSVTGEVTFVPGTGAGSSPAAP
jgi:hypothetical protein